MKFLGIDPGLSGACAVVELNENGVTGNLIPFDTPTVESIKNKKKKREYLTNNMVQFIEAHAPYDGVIVEGVTAMPEQGVTSVFAFGRGLGLWEGILAGLKIPYSKVHPASWKSKMFSNKESAKGKHASLVRAQQLFPTSTAFTLKKHEARAEAALMAVYGAKYLNGIQVEGGAPLQSTLVMEDDF